MTQAGTFKIKENWKFILKDCFSGEVISEKEKTNVITNAAKTVLRDWLYGGTGSHPVAVGIGTGTTGATASDTSLETEYTRSSATPSKPASYQVKYTKEFTFTSGTSETIDEAGLFDSAGVSGSTMFSRTTGWGQSITESTTLTVEVTITVAGA